MVVKIFCTRKAQETLERAVQDLETQLSGWEADRIESGLAPIRIAGASTAIAFHPVSLGNPRAHIIATLTVTYDYQ